MKIAADRHKPVYRLPQTPALLAGRRGTHPHTPVLVACKIEPLSRSSLCFSARIELGSWEVPELFRALVGWGSLPVAEAYRTFNMGVGMVGIGGTPPAGSFPIGELVDRPADGAAVLLV